MDIQHKLVVDVRSQILSHYISDKLFNIYKISTALNGVGEIPGSFKTPRGLHIIRAKIGAGQPLGTVFVGRRSTGEIHSEALELAYPGRDWILSRIMWLSGLELGKNRLGTCDTMRRYIYIHGGSPLRPLGIPSSKGCIRMDNLDIIKLFDLVPVGTHLLIKE